MTCFKVVGVTYFVHFLVTAMHLPILVMILSVGAIMLLSPSSLFVSLFVYVTFICLLSTSGNCHMGVVCVFKSPVSCRVWMTEGELVLSFSLHYGLSLRKRVTVYSQV